MNPFDELLNQIGAKPKPKAKPTAPTKKAAKPSNPLIDLLGKNEQARKKGEATLPKKDTRSKVQQTIAKTVGFTPQAGWTVNRQEAGVGSSLESEMHSWDIQNFGVATFGDANNVPKDKRALWQARQQHRARLEARSGGMMQNRAAGIDQMNRVNTPLVADNNDPVSRYAGMAGIGAVSPLTALTMNIANAGDVIQGRTPRGTTDIASFLGKTTPGIGDMSDAELYGRAAVSPLTRFFQEPASFARAGAGDTRTVGELPGVAAGAETVANIIPQLLAGIATGGTTTAGKAAAFLGMDAPQYGQMAADAGGLQNVPGALASQFTTPFDPNASEGDRVSSAINALALSLGAGVGATSAVKGLRGGNKAPATLPEIINQRKPVTEPKIVDENLPVPTFRTPKARVEPEVKPRPAFADIEVTQAKPRAKKSDQKVIKPEASKPAFADIPTVAPKTRAKKAVAPVEEAPAPTPTDIPTVAPKVRGKKVVEPVVKSFEKTKEKSPAPVGRGVWAATIPKAERWNYLEGISDSYKKGDNPTGTEALKHEITLQNGDTKEVYMPYQLDKMNISDHTGKRIRHSINTPYGKAHPSELFPELSQQVLDEIDATGNPKDVEAIAKKDGYSSARWFADRFAKESRNRAKKIGMWAVWENSNPTRNGPKFAYVTPFTHPKYLQVLKGLGWRMSSTSSISPELILKMSKPPTWEFMASHPDWTKEAVALARTSQYFASDGVKARLIAWDVLSGKANKIIAPEPTQPPAKFTPEEAKVALPDGIREVQTPGGIRYVKTVDGKTPVGTTLHKTVDEAVGSTSPTPYAKPAIPDPKAKLSKEEVVVNLNEAKRKKDMSKQVTWGGDKTGTRQDYADSIIESGYKARTRQVVDQAKVDKAQKYKDSSMGGSILSRSRMDDEMTQILKNPPTKTVYEVVSPSGSYREVEKSVHDYIAGKGEVYVEPKRIPKEDFQFKAKDLPDTEFHKYTQAELNAFLEPIQADVLRHTEEVGGYMDRDKILGGRFPNQDAYYKSTATKTHHGNLIQRLREGLDVPERVIKETATELKDAAEKVNVNTGFKDVDVANEKSKQRKIELANEFESYLKPKPEPKPTKEPSPELAAKGAKGEVERELPPINRTPNSYMSFGKDPETLTGFDEVFKPGDVPRVRGENADGIESAMGYVSSLIKNDDLGNMYVQDVKSRFDGTGIVKNSGEQALYVFPKSGKNGRRYYGKPEELQDIARAIKLSDENYRKQSAAPEPVAPKPVETGRSYKITNIESLSRGVGAKYIVGVESPDGKSLVAYKWSRSADADLKSGQVLVDLNGNEVKRYTPTRKQAAAANFKESGAKEPTALSNIQKQAKVIIADRAPFWQQRAKAGGEVGPNGEQYAGGQFIARFPETVKGAKAKLQKTAESSAQYKQRNGLSESEVIASAPGAGTYAMPVGRDYNGKVSRREDKPGRFSPSTNEPYTDADIQRINSGIAEWNANVDKIDAGTPGFRWLNEKGEGKLVIDTALHPEYTDASIIANRYVLKGVPIPDNFVAKAKQVLPGIDVAKYQELAKAQYADQLAPTRKQSAQAKFSESGEKLKSLDVIKGVKQKGNRAAVAKINPEWVAAVRDHAKNAIELGSATLDEFVKEVMAYVPQKGPKTRAAIEKAVRDAWNSQSKPEPKPVKQTKRTDVFDDGSEGTPTGLARRFEDAERKATGKAPTAPQGTTPEALKAWGDREYQRDPVAVANIVQQAFKDQSGLNDIDAAKVYAYKEVIRTKLTKAVKDGEEGTAQILEQELNKISEVAQNTRGLWHRIGQALQINSDVTSDMSVGGLIERGTLSGGGVLDANIKKQLTEIAKKYETAVADLEAYKAKAQAELSALKDKMGASVASRRVARQRTDAIKILTSKGFKYVGEPIPSASGLKSKKSGAMLRPEFLDRDEASAIRQLVNYHIKDSDTTSLTEIVGKIQNDFPDITDRHIYAALSNDYRKAWTEATVAQSRARQIMNGIKRDAEYRKMKPLGRAARITGEILNATQRGLQASYDISAPLIQGLPTAMVSPLTWAKSWGPMMNALVKGPNAAEKVMAQIRNHPSFPEAMQAGLDLSDVNGSFMAQEEIFAGSLIPKIAEMKLTLKNAPMAPLKLAAKGVEHSDAAFTTYMNTTRWSLYQNLMKNAPKGDRERLAFAKDVASIVNVLSGKGTGKPAKMLKSAGEVPGLLLYAPRFYVSLFQNAVLPVGSYQTGKGRAMATRVYAQQAAAILTILGASKMMGAEVDEDPRSTRFGRIQMPNGVEINLFGRVIEPVRTISQMMYGKISGKGTYVAPGEYNDYDIYDWLASKASPILRLADSARTGMRYDDNAGKRVEASFSDMAIANFTPISLRSIIGKAVDEKTPLTLKQLSALEILGINVGKNREGKIDAPKFNPIPVGLQRSKDRQEGKLKSEPGKSSATTSSKPLSEMTNEELQRVISGGG